MKISQSNKQLLLYAIAMAALLFLLKWLEMRLLIFSNAFEVYAGLIAVVFTLLGIWLAKKLSAPSTAQTSFNQTMPAQTSDAAKALEANISARELEVLELLAKGFSNAEIGEQLFVSTNTVKTHVSSIFSKLGAGKRVQAIEKARALGIITQTYENREK